MELKIKDELEIKVSMLLKRSVDISDNNLLKLLNQVTDISVLGLTVGQISMALDVRNELSARYLKQFTRM